LDNKGNPVKIKYILPEKITRIGVENKEQQYRGRLNPIDVKQAVITIHDILVEYYNDKGKKLDDSNAKFYRKYPFIIEDYKRDFEKRFEVFDIRIIRY
jgi:alanine dehydrogenase